MKRESVVLTLIVSLFLGGCALQRAQKVAVPETAAVKNPLPQWYIHPPANDEVWAYGKGEGMDANLSLQRAKTNLKQRASEELSATMRRMMSNKEGPFRYLQPDVLQKIEKRFDALTIPPVEIVEKDRIGPNRYLTLVRLSKKAWAEPLKHNFVKRLVAIEEAWWRGKGKDTLTRYRLAVDSSRALKRLLPDYLLIQGLAPFPTTIRKRVENGLYYFIQTSKRLKKRLVYCVEPAPTSALKLFSQALAKALRHRHALLLKPHRANASTLCIRLGGKFAHTTRQGEHVVTGHIDLKIHERYGAPLFTKHYTVVGRAEESGTVALENAADAFEKRVEREGIFSE